MDAALQLALMQKIRSTFESDRLLVAFPVVPASFSAASLAAVNVGSSSAEQLNSVAGWSRLVNLVPSGDILLEANRPLLWDVMDGLFRSSTVVAKGQPSADDKPKLSQAEATLYRVVNDARVPSEKLLAYNEYRDIWLSANQAMRKRSIEVQMSSDPSAKTFWETVEKPVFDSRIHEAADLWRVSGFHQEVDDAYRIIRRIDDSDPRRAWNQWSDRFVRDRDVHGDINSGTFVPTGFGPDNFTDPSTPWLSFSLERDEIQALVASAPAALKQRFSSGGSTTDVQSLSFEYTSVSVVRGWFAPEVFSARFWKFTGASNQLSDGALPPHGDCPGYIAAAIFVRNLSITTLASASPAPVPSAQQTIGVFRDYHTLIRQVPKPPSNIPNPPGTRRPPVVVTDHRRDRRGHFDLTGDSAPPLEKPGESPRFDAKKIGVESSFSRSPTLMTRPALRPAAASPPNRATAAISTHVLSPKVSTFSRKNDDFRRLLVVGTTLGTTSATPSPAMPRTVTNTIYANGDVGIVAFLWAAFPKSPDPDPGLDWP